VRYDDYLGGLFRPGAHALSDRISLVNSEGRAWLRSHDDTYDVPFGCFVPQRGESILAAGRCLSAQHEAMASARVTAQCFSYGHAMGHAAVLAVRERLGVREIQAADVRRLLTQDGVRFDG